MNDPLVTAGVAPFLAGFVVTLLLFKLRLGGLAAVAGFCTTAWLTGVLVPVGGSVRQKMVLVALAAPALGLVADFAFRAGRMTAYVLGAIFAVASFWVFWTGPSQARLLVGLGIVLFVAWTVAFTASLHANSVRGGAAALALGLGAGFAALWSGGILGYGAIALGAAAGGFLFMQMLLGQRIEAGLVFCLAAGVLAALVAAAALVYGVFGWLPLAILALVPLAARLPLPARWPVWGQSILASIYTLLCGGAALFAARVQSRGWPSWLQ
jgi:hypothetical protein